MGRNASANSLHVASDPFFHHGADLDALNRDFVGEKPSEIMRFTMERAQNPVVFTNFRPLAVAFLHLVTREKPDIPVIWVDHGYNTPETYRHIESVVSKFNLNLRTYAPKMSAAHYHAVYGGIPPLDTPEHDFFSRTVKLEPFNRAMGELKPDVWLNGIRHDQNAHRKNLDIFTLGNHGTIRVAPMFHLREVDVEGYVYDNKLPDNDVYFDPTKGEEHRECGLLLEK
ncbi:phosphoadenosine phosphosulfate reductase family protein [Microbulbifer spongiae]|uniref:Phosphoadenosine phosphosulfate reductase family protein n=1 Tax=Microbulbifer spongiae TaxID=2944933 RepID=A0ABY9ECA1_9GAMM|nr:phosphoadenosine phosphosulfate reductase family protein [Microbulbifer sp. MI-G]WKD49907.1 phosphoadenosine phosphosulfate reductase family protein [Microbulbifer sp. MI-G]